MSAGKYDIVIEQGATFPLPLTVKQGGVPIVFTGINIRMQIREQHNSTVLLTLNSDTAEGIVITNPGQIAITITDEQTDLLTIARGVYDIRMEFADGHSEYLLRGQVVVIPRVTAPS